LNSVIFQLDLKKMLLDRMVHLVSKGYVLPVCSYVKSCFENQGCDISLIRYFLTEVSESIHTYVHHLQSCLKIHNVLMLSM